ncbi:Chromosome transmission fidelity protein 18 [Blattella germanica]|nr:Chromosome transmission fidelity protein 18 [Blattella germanica]
MQGMTPLVRAHVNSSPLLYDTLSPLLQIMIPTLRPVNTQLYSKRETEELNNVVSIMIDYNLNYIQERTQEGGYEYKLDPNIEEIALFPGSKPIRNLGYAGKQLIAREVELEKLRRTERENKSSTSTSSTDVSTNKSSTSTSSTDVSTNKSKPAAMPDQTLKPKAVVEMVS